MTAVCRGCLLNRPWHVAKCALERPDLAIVYYPDGPEVVCYDWTNAVVLAEAVLERALEARR